MWQGNRVCFNSCHFCLSWNYSWSTPFCRSQHRQRPCHWLSLNNPQSSSDRFLFSSWLCHCACHYLVFQMGPYGVMPQNGKNSLAGEARHPDRRDQHLNATCTFVSPGSFHFMTGSSLSPALLPQGLNLSFFLPTSAWITLRLLAPLVLLKHKQTLTLRTRGRLSGAHHSGSVGHPLGTSHQDNLQRDSALLWLCTSLCWTLQW